MNSNLQRQSAQLFIDSLLRPFYRISSVVLSETVTNIQLIVDVEDRGGQTELSM